MSVDTKSNQLITGATRGSLRDLGALLRRLVNGEHSVPTYTVATAPSDATAGRIIYVSNGAAGSAILAFGDGSNWKRSDTGATISAS